jgi:predicted PurR-regulated permease PerM
MHTQKSNIASHIMIACLILGVLAFKLSAGVIAGFLVESALARRYPTMHARGVAPALVIAVVVIAVLGAVLGFWQLVKGQHGVAGISDMMADVLSRMHSNVPAWLDAYLPASTDDAKAKAATMLRKYSEQISAVGMGTLRGRAHVLIGIIVAAMLAWGRFATGEAYQPLSQALLKRLSGLTRAFERVVFAQVRISLLNTVLSALYLQVALPVAGVHVPFSKTLVAFTFVAGMIPVVGNLISNTAILVVTLGVSFDAALVSLVLLVLVHKLEYFANARIVGHRIEAKAWEILLVMAGMEALFGLQGVIIAPVLYAYVKGELKAANLIGRVEKPVGYDSPGADRGGVAEPAAGILRPGPVAHPVERQESTANDSIG